MSMDGDTLGLAMLNAYNGVGVSQTDIDDLGDHLYEERMAEYSDLMSEYFPGHPSTAINEEWGKRIARRDAKTFLTWFFDNPGSTAEDRFKAMGAAIVSHISSNATIAPLVTDGGTPAGSPTHIHTPSTISATGKIS